MGIVISGFPGVGKSTLGKKLPNFFDLDSTPFKNQHDLYAQVAKFFATGSVCTVSSHEDVRRALRNEDVDYIVVVPYRDLKQEYMRRYKSRNNSKDFIDLLDREWDNWLDNIHKTEKTVIECNYMEDILPKLKAKGII